MAVREVAKFVYARDSLLFCSEHDVTIKAVESVAEMEFDHTVTARHRFSKPPGRVHSSFTAPGVPVG